jgi:hypothetical protein
LSNKTPTRLPWICTCPRGEQRSPGSIDMATTNDAGVKSETHASIQRVTVHADDPRWRCRCSHAAVVGMDELLGGKRGGLMARGWRGGTQLRGRRRSAIRKLKKTVQKDHPRASGLPTPLSAKPGHPGGGDIRDAACPRQAPPTTPVPSGRNREPCMMPRSSVGCDANACKREALGLALQWSKGQRQPGCAAVHCHCCRPGGQWMRAEVKPTKVGTPENSFAWESRQELAISKNKGRNGRLEVVRRKSTEKHTSRKI